ncbi:Major facilitator superfamily (MFS) profile domain-containing protein [Plasmodiophora brassicae]|uniref:Major facilitator superfamily (MFS) profile domain-containing protein n=1 Tax=Plasmodiophora brassicae TaxID=37360 RepID=A0A3P3Y327_PLABS|nr:unnamed protein product [Plasmodiophora brassicae]
MKATSDGSTTSISDDVSVDVSKDQSDEKENTLASSNRPWVLVSTFLILSTLLQSVKPSEAYAPFYFRDARHLSKDVINSAIYPFRTYAMLFGLLPVTFLAESICGYVPVIVFGLICRWATQFGLYYGPGLISLQLSYAVFGLSHATKIIYSAFTYRMVPLHVFHRITGYIRGANLVAHVVGGSLGQLIYMQYPPVVDDTSSKLTDPFFLQFTISQISIGIGVILFFAAINIHRKQGGDAGTQRLMKPTLSLSSLRQLLRSVYATRRTILYSVWWCISFATVELVWDYQSVLFLNMKQTMNYTGLVTSAARLACATSAMLAGRSRNIVNDYGLVITSIGAVVIGVGLLVSAFTYDLAVSYVAFLSLVMINEFCYCSATAEIAMATSDSLRGVALLSNTIIAMFIQTLLQFICGPQVLDVSIRTKYMTWSVFMGLLSVFMLGAILARPRHVVGPREAVALTVFPAAASD